MVGEHLSFFRLSFFVVSERKGIVQVARCCPLDAKIKYGANGGVENRYLDTATVEDE
jgi:hypothetical protein